MIITHKMLKKNMKHGGRRRERYILREEGRGGREGGREGEGEEGVQ